MKEIENCKVIAGESVAKQHRVVVCRMCLEAKKRKSLRAEPKIRWWKLKEEECCVKCREMTMHTLGGNKERLEEWTYIAEVLRQNARQVLGVSFGRRKPGKETWRWNK